MSDVEVIIKPEVFNDVYRPFLERRARTEILFGGSGSGKSVFVAQRCIIDMLASGRNYLICRQVGRTLRGSVFTQVCRVIAEWGLSRLFTINKTDMLITCQNGYQIIFAGLDDVEKLKSLIPARGVITDVWVEEATEADAATIKQLKKRQRGGSDDVREHLIMTFNPVYKTHWIYTEFFKALGWRENQTEYFSDELSILKTWYVHNKFLTADDVRDLENEQDQYYRDVYTFGNWGVLGHVIFRNWSVQDLSKMRDQFTNHRNGLDFGFSSDPAAGWFAHYDRAHKTIYLYDELYETGLTNDVLAERISGKIGRDSITCDSAEPKSIAELQRLGINARSARKGKDSVLHGIQWLQQQKIIIDSGCINAQNEFSTYHWKEDAGGNALPVPVDKNNHLIDAARYAHEEDSLDGSLQILFGA